MAIDSFPGSAVCYILSDIPGQGEFQGTGVIIGPHTILTAAHLLWDSDAGAGADGVSVYPGFVPGTATYNPAGAVSGLQSIHYVKITDSDDTLSARATQADFAVIDTSADLSGFGRFALDPTFKGGDVVATGYPSSKGGYQTGTEAVVSKEATFSDLDSRRLRLSPGYSGGPLWDRVERGGASVPAVVGTVSTNGDAMKLTKGKIALIRQWIHSDGDLYAGGTDTPGGITPQIDGTLSSSADAAQAAPRTSAAELAAAIASPRAHGVASITGGGSGDPGRPHPSRWGALASAFGRATGWKARGSGALPEPDVAGGGALSDLVHALHGTRGSADLRVAGVAGDHAIPTLAASAGPTLHAPPHGFSLGA